MPKRLATDVPTILDRLGIEYVTTGKNVKQGNVNVPCPFCRDDPSEHMGIGIYNGYWACWRNKAHRGRNLARLITRLARVDYHRAMSVAYAVHVPEEYDMSAVAAGTLWQSGPEKRKGTVEELLLPPEFRSLRLPKRYGHGSQPFVDYMKGRGFGNMPRRLSLEYDLHYARTGEYRDRIILPHYFNGELVTWTARTIWPSVTPRYLALAAEESILPTKSTLYNYDNALEGIAEGATVLVLVEGPFDTLKVDWYGYQFGVRAVGLGSTTLEDAQLAMLNTLLKGYKQVVVLLDRAAVAQAHRLAGEVSPVCLRGQHPFVEPLPKGVDDPGELTEAQATKLTSNLARTFG